MDRNGCYPFDNRKIAEDWLVSELAGELMVQYGRAE